MWILTKFNENSSKPYQGITYISFRLIQTYTEITSFLSKLTWLMKTVVISLDVVFSISAGLGMLHISDASNVMLLIKFFIQRLQRFFMLMSLFYIFNVLILFIERLFTCTDKTMQANCIHCLFWSTSSEIACLSLS